MRKGALLNATCDTSPTLYHDNYLRERATGFARVSHPRNVLAGAAGHPLTCAPSATSRLACVVIKILRHDTFFAPPMRACVRSLFASEASGYVDTNELFILFRLGTTLHECPPHLRTRTGQRHVDNACHSVRLQHAFVLTQL